MNELDSASILSRETLATSGNCDATRDHGRPAATTTCFKPPPYRLCSLITVEPLVFLMYTAVTVASSTTTQYIYGVVSTEVGYNGSKASRCNNASLPIDPLEQVKNLLDTVTYSVVRLVFFSYISYIRVRFRSRITTSYNKTLIL